MVRKPRGTIARMALRRFAVARSGLAALEFALILPILVALYLGGVEIGDALTIKRKVTHITSTVTDLVTQAKTLTSAEMENILDAAAAIVSPYDAAKLKIKVSAIQIDATGKSTIAWSASRHDTKPIKGSIVTVPPEVKSASSFLISAEVHYPYTPTFGYVMTGTFDLDDTFYLRPRLSDTITCATC